LANEKFDQRGQLIIFSVFARTRNMHWDDSSYIKVRK